MELTDSETRTMKDVGFVARFAAETVDKLDPKVLLVLGESREAAEKNGWTPEMSQKFWSAFNTLCVLIRPVTIDCLTATQDNSTRFNWIRFKYEPVSLANRTSGRYLRLLFTLIMILLPLQLYVWIGTIESRAIDNSLTKAQASATALTGDYLKLSAQTADLPADKWTSDQKAQAETIYTNSIVLNDDLDRLPYEVMLLRRLYDLKASSHTAVSFA